MSGISEHIRNIIISIKKLYARIAGKSYVRAGRCRQCGFCCTMINLFIEGRPVKTEEEFEYLKIIYPSYERFTSCGFDKDGHMMFTCNFLEEDFKCHDYKNRPQICRTYPSEEIFRRGGKLVSKCGYEFIPISDFQALLDDKLKNSQSGDV